MHDWMRTSNAPRRRFCSDFHFAARWYKLFTFLVKFSASSSTLRCAEIAPSSFDASNWSCAVCRQLSAFAISAFACADQTLAHTHTSDQTSSSNPNRSDVAYWLRSDAARAALRRPARSHSAWQISFFAPIFSFCDGLQPRPSSSIVPEKHPPKRFLTVTNAPIEHHPA